ncbi:MAG: hypothetical protein WDN23_14885 [Edaphobacter sp.]
MRPLAQVPVQARVRVQQLVQQNWQAEPKLQGLRQGQQPEPVPTRSSYIRPES